MPDAGKKGADPSGPAAKRAAAKKAAAAAAAAQEAPEAGPAQPPHEAHAGAIEEADASVEAASGGDGGLGGADRGSKAVYSSNAASHPFAPAVGETDGDASDILGDELVEAISPAKLPEQKGISRGGKAKLLWPRRLRMSRLCWLMMTPLATCARLHRALVDHALMRMCPLPYRHTGRSSGPRIGWTRQSNVG